MSDSAAFGGEATRSTGVLEYWDQKLSASTGAARGHDRSKLLAFMWAGASRLVKHCAGTSLLPRQCVSCVEWVAREQELPPTRRCRGRTGLSAMVCIRERADSRQHSSAPPLQHSLRREHSVAVPFVWHRPHCWRISQSLERLTLHFSKPWKKSPCPFPRLLKTAVTQRGLQACVNVAQASRLCWHRTGQRPEPRLGSAHNCTKLCYRWTSPIKAGKRNLLFSTSVFRRLGKPTPKSAYQGGPPLRLCEPVQAACTPSAPQGFCFRCRAGRVGLRWRRWQGDGRLAKGKK